VVPEGGLQTLTGSISSLLILFVAKQRDRIAPVVDGAAFLQPRRREVLFSLETRNRVDNLERQVVDFHTEAADLTEEVDT
jgi:hypothetical protein